MVAAMIGALGVGSVATTSPAKLIGEVAGVRASQAD
jgi:hypothetical protein